MPSSLITVDGTDQVYSSPDFCQGTFRLAAQEGFSEGWARLLTLYQTRWALLLLLLFSFNAFTR